jgi:hypothetical protein
MHRATISARQLEVTTARIRAVESGVRVSAHSSSKPYKGEGQCQAQDEAHNE